jgi:hypothetical protein
MEEVRLARYPLRNHRSRRSGEGGDSLYDIVFNGEVIIHRDRLPEHNAARVLLVRGLKGKLIFLDAKTGKERLIFNDIETAAKCTVSETREHGPRLVRWRPFPSVRSSTGDVLSGDLAPEPRGAFNAFLTLLRGFRRVA